MEYKHDFPKDLLLFKLFVSQHLFNLDKVEDDICKKVIEKINNKDFDFTEVELNTMRAISNIGDVCTCDTDHRIGNDKKNCAFSYF